MRKYLFLGWIMVLAGSLSAQTPYLFTRYDSVAVRSGTDTLRLAWAGGINYAQFNTIDLNGDGVKDLFVFDRTGNKPLCFLHQPGANNIEYRYAPEYEMQFPTMMNWAILKDYNCDGLEDLWTYTPGGIRLYKNTSSGGVLSFVLVKDLIRSWQLGNYVNLYVSSVDLAGIEDIDGDGDMDVLTFGVFGTSLEYHRNYSVENGFGCDSLDYTLMNQCWGCFTENQTNNSVYLNDTCANTGIPNPQLAELIEEATERDKNYRDDPDNRSVLRHSGSCTCVLDVNGDNMQDLLMGDVSFSNEVLVVNGATVPNAHQCMTSLDTLFPVYDTPIKLELFPCSFFLDVNNDGKRDLVVTPQSTGSSENQKSVLYYLNSNTDAVPNFSFVKRDFLQDEMIEKGEGAYPVLADYNGDGLLDLFVASYGFYNPVNDSVFSQISLYKNIGTATVPSFELVTENYESLDVLINRRSYYPTFGDLDNDGDDEMIVGNELGILSLFTNIAGAGNPYDHQLTQAGMTDDVGNIIDVGQFSAPLLIDIDRDNDLDLLVGNKSGKITYYQNTGTITTPLFKYITDYFGQLNVKEWWDASGYSVPSIYDDNGEYQLFIGSKAGWVHHYNNIDGNLSGAFTRVDTTVFEVLDGLRTSPAVADLNNDGQMDMLLGNYRGGISYYNGDYNGTSGLNEIMQQVKFMLYPNPANQQVTLNADKFGVNADVHIYDMVGNKIQFLRMTSSRIDLNIESWSNGIYLVQIISEGKTQTLKLVKNESR